MILTLMGQQSVSVKGSFMCSREHLALVFLLCCCCSLLNMGLPSPGRFLYAQVEVWGNLTVAPSAKLNMAYPELFFHLGKMLCKPFLGSLRQREESPSCCIRSNASKIAPSLFTWVSLDPSQAIVFSTFDRFFVCLKYVLQHAFLPRILGIEEKGP